MAGYIGSKAVNLSTTGADINGDANIDGTLSSDGLTVDGDATLQNILNIGGSDPQIRTDTSDGSDNKTLWMGGGGVAYSWDRGGFFYAQGNEAGGHVGIAAGNVSGGSIKFTTGASESMRISSAGSVGIGVVPETWNSLKALQINSQASVSADASSIQLGANCYYNSGWKYINGAAATNYYQDSGVHVWRTAASGSADTAISWSEAMRIDSSGNVGIGTSSPSHPLTSAVNAASSNPLTDGANYALAIQNTDATAGNAVSMAFGHGGYNYTNFISSIRTGTGTDPKGDLIFGGRPSDGGTFVERMRLDSSGQVGINTATPNNYYAKKLVIDIGSDVQNGITIASGTGNSGMFAFADGTSGDQRYRGYLNYNHSNDSLGIGTAGSEAMRLDSSGNLLVGTTDINPFDNTTGSGIALRSTGAIYNAIANGTPLNLNRMSSDGTIAQFRKDGSVVGSIGTLSSRLHIENGDTGLRIAGDLDQIFPCGSGGADRDNAIDLGSSGIRFDDIYATNGTIQTSDRNEKQDIAELSDAEQRVAVAAKGLLRKFRWRDAVTEKGDEARTHFGIIAQDLQAAFAAEGLDAGDYAMFISSTWTDEETGEERTRMGVRYSELLAFIIGAL